MSFQQISLHAHPAGGVAEDVLTRVERAIFSMFYSMRNERSTHPRIRAIFFIVQMLQLFFAVCPTPLGARASSVVNGLLGVLDFSFSSLSVPALIATFAAVISVVVLVGVAALLATLLAGKEDTAWLSQWPLRVLRTGAFVFGLHMLCIS